MNVSNRNLLLRNTDLNIAGRGSDLRIIRYYNSGDGNDSAGRAEAPLGVAAGRPNSRWQLSVGQSLRVYPNSVAYADGTGAILPFQRAARAATAPFITPPGSNATLSYTAADDSYTLTFVKTKAVYRFVKTDPTDPMYQLATITDRNNNIVTFSYTPTAGEADRLNTIVDSRDRTITFGYDTADRLARITDSTGRHVDYGYDVDGQLSSYTDAAGAVTTYSYTSGFLTGVSGPTPGAALSIRHDATAAGAGAGRVAELEQTEDAYVPEPGSAPPTRVLWRYAGATTSNTTTVTDPRGGTTTYTSEHAGYGTRVTKVVDAAGRTQSRTFNANAAVSSLTPAGGQGAQLTLTYDAENINVERVQTPSGASSSFTYATGSSVPTSSTDSRKNISTADYDSRDNRRLTTGADGTRLVEIYQNSTTPDPDWGGAPGSCTVDSTGAVVASTRVGLRCETRDGLYVKGASRTATTAHRTLFQYNLRGELVKTIPGTAAATPAANEPRPQSYTHDALSRVATITDGNNKTITNTYDALDRPKTTTFADSSSVTYDYDPAGNLTATTERNSAGTSTATTSYSLRNLPRVQTKDGVQIETQHDLAGNLRAYTDDGGTVLYRYNTTNNLEALTEPGGDCTGLSLQTGQPPATSKCTLFGYDDNDIRTTIRYPGSSSLAATSDASGRLATMKWSSSGQVRLDLVYDYKVGTADTVLLATRTLSITDLATTVSRRQTFSYDKANRLTGLRSTDLAGTLTSAEGFCYDRAGNRVEYAANVLTCDVGGTDTTPANNTSSYGAANQQLTSTATAAESTTALTGTGFTTDGNGAQTSSRSTPGVSTSYNDRQQATSFTPAGGTAFTATYRGADQVERRTAGTATFTTGPLGLAAKRDSATGLTTHYTRDADGTLISLRVGPTSTPASSRPSYYPFTDNLGSIYQLVDSTGTVRNSYRYSAYGVPTTVRADIDNNLGFTGAYRDTPTGLYKLGLRYYDPTHGRFTAPDPTGQDPHYTYALNNPTNYVDPTGLEAANVLQGVGTFLQLASVVPTPLSKGVAVVGVGVSFAGNYQDKGLKSALQAASIDAASIAFGKGVAAGVGHRYGRELGEAAEGASAAITTGISTCVSFC